MSCGFCTKTQEGLKEFDDYELPVEPREGADYTPEAIEILTGRARELITLKQCQMCEEYWLCLPMPVYNRAVGWILDKIEVLI